MDDKNRLQRVLSFFNLTQNSEKNTGKTLKTDIVPGKKGKEGKDDYKLTPIHFPTDVQKAYEFFLENQHLYNPNRERFELYKSLLFMERNGGVVANAIFLYTQESYESKDGQRPIQIKSKDRKVEKYFNTWLDTIGFNTNILQALAHNLVLFGDSFFVNTFDMEKGVTGIQVLDPFLVKDRIELSLNNIEDMRLWTSSNQNYTNRYGAIKQIVKAMEDGLEGNNDYSYYYNSFLLGYEMKYSIKNDQASHALPPWCLTHFRVFTTESEFFPFGKSLFINCLAPYQSYKTTEMLIDMLRVASFPKEVVKIKGGETLTVGDRFKRVEEVRQFIENISPVTNNKDNMGINERYYSIEDLFELDTLDSNIDMDKLGDLEKKLDDLILSTGIPDSYLIPSKGSGLGGENAAALYYNNKIFQRRVESIRSAILEGFSELFRLHLATTNDFNGEKTEFELFMPVNSEIYSSDKIRQDSDMLRLATDMLNNLGQAIGMDRGESLPIEVVKDIFATYINIDEDILNRWLDKAIKKAEEEEENPPYNGTPAPMVIPTEGFEAGGADSGGSKTSFKKPSKKMKEYSSSVKRFIESYRRGEEDDLLREAYFKAKRENGFTNGVLGNYIYWNDSYSNKINESFNIFDLVKRQKVEELAKLNRGKLKD